MTDMCIHMCDPTRTRTLKPLEVNKSSYLIQPLCTFVCVSVDVQKPVDFLATYGAGLIVASLFGTGVAPSNLQAVFETISPFT